MTHTLKTHYYLGCYRKTYSTHITTCEEKVTCEDCLKLPLLHKVREAATVKVLLECPELPKSFTLPRRIGHE